MASRSVLRLGVTFVMVVVAFAAMAAILGHDSQVCTFFLQSWYIQGLSSWLFLIGVWLCAERGIATWQAQHLLNEVKIPDRIDRAEASRLITAAPEAWHGTLTVRRFRRILEAVRSGEDLRAVGRQATELDVVQLERGHLTIDNIKSVIPVIGFLGTVVGLSIGMLYFPDSTDMDKLRADLHEFAKGLSVAFNTTLLALAYAIILTLFSTLLRESERTLLEALEEAVDSLIKSVK